MKKWVPLALKRRGFSFIEAILSIALLSIAVLGLAQLFLLGLANNHRGNQISNALFLAQQELDELRTLTAAELTNLASPIDDTLDVNNDHTMDFRRITRLTAQGLNWTVDIWIFSGAQITINAATLIGDPNKYKVKAQISSVICR